MTGYTAPWDQKFGADQAQLLNRVATLERQIAHLTSGPVAVLSAAHPASPVPGQQILETDTGLEAYWSGSAWVYPPQLIQSQVLGVSASTVSFTIPQVFTDVRLEICARSTGTTSTGWDAAGIQLNGITAASYNWNSFYTTQGAAAVSVAGGTGATNAQIAEVWNSFFAGTGGRGVTTVRIPGYSTTGNLKVMTSTTAASDGGSAGILQTYSGTLGAGNTGAITSLKVLMGIGSFVAGSSFGLFGE